MPQASALVGLKDLHYATLTTDTSATITYAVPTKIAPAINAKISPTQNTETLYADDGPAEIVTTLGEIAVELEVSDVPIEVQAVLLGHTVNADGVLIKKATDTAPYIAIGFKSQKANGKFRYVWLYKGKFELIEEEYQTKEDKASFKTPKLKGTFIKREKDSAWQATGDEDATGFTAAKATAWFTAVYAAPVV
jgi:phi13 family phage major tail protein